MNSTGCAATDVREARAEGAYTLNSSQARQPQPDHNYEDRSRYEQEDMQEDAVKDTGDGQEMAHYYE